MKYIVVTTRLGGRGENQIKYPPVYDAIDVDRNIQGGLVYQGRHDEGDATGEILMFMKNALADTMLVDPDVRELTKAEADTWLVDNPNLKGEPTELVDDADRLQAIIAKNAAGITLSAEDLAALDPDDDTVRGIKRKLRTADGWFGPAR